jgi:hypothetical protein
MAGLDPSPPGRPKAKYNGSAPASEDRPVVAPERFAVGRNRGVCLIGRAGRPLARSIWIFLDRHGFAPESPENKAWISLDFLGFSRLKRDFSMGYARFFATKNFSRPFAAGRRASTGAGILTMRKRSVAHRVSLTRFLLFCNELPSKEMSILCELPTGRH